MNANLLCSLLLLAPAQGPAKPQPYPRAELLIEIGDLIKPQAAKKYRLLDARSDKEFKAGHIPLAVAVDVADWNKKFTAGPDVKTWEKELGQLGIDADTPIVVYGDDMRETARIWYILRYWGIKDVRILNGGWIGWTAAKHPQEKGPAQAVIAAKSPKLIPAEQRLATLDQVKNSLAQKTFQIIDTRTEGEYCGDIKVAKKAGAIPGAIHLEWKEMLDTNTQRFKTAKELAQIFKQAGIDLAKPSVAHCQSGGRSSVMVFAMELMGANDVRNYYRSWAEWGNAADTPIELPKKK